MERLIKCAIAGWILAWTWIGTASGAETKLWTAPAWFPKPAALSAAPADAIHASDANGIVAGAEKLREGGTLVIEAGVYFLPRPIVLSGRTNITIRSASGEPAAVTLQGQGWEKGDKFDDLIHIGRCDGVTIEGITFAEARSYGIKVEAEHGPRHIQIYHCRFLNIGMRAIKGSAGKDPAVRAVEGSVRFCDFENTKIPPADWLYSGDYIAGIDMMALENWHFSENTFRNIKGRNGAGRAAIFIWVRSRQIVVENNWIMNCDRGISFGNPGQSTVNLEGEALTYVAEGVIQNNMITGGADCGIELWHTDGIKVRHNYVWRPEQNWNRGIRIGKAVRNTEVAHNFVHGKISVEGSEPNLHDNHEGDIGNGFTNPETGDLTLKPASSMEWIEPMKRVHARFKGTPGTCAQFGDSITFSGAYWTSLASAPKNMSADDEANYRAVKKHFQPESFRQKGPEFGNQGSMTIRWARENAAKWLANLNPEIAVIMFGSNDVGQMNVDEFEKTTREVVNACLANGTITILTTPPPQTARLEKCEQFADAVRTIAREMQIPLIDYAREIEARRPFDWDGSAPAFKAVPGDTYEVPTLISRDGVHPSNPSASANNFSTEALSNNGFNLRNYLTMTMCAEVLHHVVEVR